MRLLVSGATVTMARLTETPRGRRFLGVLLEPRGANAVPDGSLPWACDNGCYHGLDETAFRAMLARAAAASVRPLWVACPDVVGDADATADLWPEWMLEIHARGLTPCYVLQDGQEHRGGLPDARAFFVGGTTQWKFGPACLALCREVKAGGALLHGGRVNTWQRFRQAAHAGCDTVDGSGFSKWPDIRIPKALRWLAHLDALDRHPVLF